MIFWHIFIYFPVICKNPQSRKIEMLKLPILYFESATRRLADNAKFLSIILTCLIFLIEATLIFIGNFNGDYWEHISVLQELIREPFHPRHPIIDANLPHAFFSPYLVLLGIIGHYTSASAFFLLSFAAVVNLALFLYGAFLFVRIFFHQNIWSIYFCLLLLHFFAWGPWAWGWSSFFHFRILHYVLAYPSTFAVSCTFISAFLCVPVLPYR
jgi:hypothetical protein